MSTSSAQPRSRSKTPPAGAERAVRRLHRVGPALLLALAGGAFLMLRWKTLEVPFERDEGEYAYSAWLLRQGLAPYQNAFLQKPPLVAYTFWAAQAVSPGVAAPRVLAMISLLAAVVCLGLTARRELGGGGASAAALALAMLVLPDLAPFAANTEVFMLAPLAAVLLVYTGDRARGRIAAWAAAGALGAAALLYKPICLPVLSLLGSVWAYECWRAGGLRRAARGVATGCAAAAATTLAAIGWFLPAERLAPLWESTVSFNVWYAQLGEPGDALARQLRVLAENWWPLGLLGLGLAFARGRRTWLHGGLLLAAWAGVYRSGNLHSMIQLVPFLALLGAAGLESANRRLRVGGFRHAAAALAVVALSIPALPLLRLPPAALARAVYGGANPFAEAQAVARRVADLTRPADPVFVAGSEPQILYHARRRSPSRFVIVYPLMLDTPLAAAYQRECIGDLQRHPPAAIVLAQSNMSWLTSDRSPKLLLAFLARALEQDYRLVGGFVPDAVFGSWREPLGAAREDAASLLVYVRRAAAP